MTKADEYRLRAANIVEEAENTLNLSKRLQLLTSAIKWRELADQIEKEERAVRDLDDMDSERSN